MNTLGPFVAPLKDLVCKTNGTWFVTSPRARNGAKSRGSFADLDFAESVLMRFRGGGEAFSLRSGCATVTMSSGYQLEGATQNPVPNDQSESTSYGPKRACQNLPHRRIN